MLESVNSSKALSELVWRPELDLKILVYIVVPIAGWALIERFQSARHTIPSDQVMTNGVRTTRGCLIGLVETIAA